MFYFKNYFLYNIQLLKHKLNGLIENKDLVQSIFAACFIYYFIYQQMFSRV